MEPQQVRLGYGGFLGPGWFLAQQHDYKPGFDPATRFQALSLTAVTWDLTMDVADRVLRSPDVQVDSDAIRVVLADAPKNPVWVLFRDALKEAS